MREMRLTLLLHLFLLRTMEVSKMRHPTNIERPVRLRRRTQVTRYLGGKSVYKRERIELTIPAKFKDIIEPFLNKDLKVEAKVDGNRLFIDAEPLERLPRKRSGTP